MACRVGMATAVSSRVRRLKEPIPRFAALLLATMSLSALAAEAPGSSRVVENAFCVAKTKSGCNEFAGGPDGGQVSITRLPVIDGQRVLYFHSAQAMEPGATIAHFWNSNDQGAYRPRATYYVSEHAKQAGSGILNAFTNTVEKLEAGNFGVAFRNSTPNKARAYRAWSLRHVYGPGRHTAYPSKVDGTKLPGGTMQAITVTAGLDASGHAPPIAKAPPAGSP